MIIQGSFDSTFRPVSSTVSSERREEPRDSKSSQEGVNSLPFNVRNQERIRIIQVAESGIQIEELSGNRDSGLDSLSRRNNPQTQYQNTQNLLQRESIAQSIGIDLYA